MAAAPGPACRRARARRLRRRQRRPPPPICGRASFSRPWRFRGSQDSRGAEATAFDDRNWPSVTVPHTGARTRSERLVSPPPSHRAAGAGPPCLRRVRRRGRVRGRVSQRAPSRAASRRVHAFVFDATEHVVEGENVLAVRANNELLSTADSLPSGTGKQLYNLYGGIYRKARLVQTGRRARRSPRPRVVRRLRHAHERDRGRRGPRHPRPRAQRFGHGARSWCVAACAMPEARRWPRWKHGDGGAGDAGKWSRPRTSRGPSSGAPRTRASTPSTPETVVDGAPRIRVKETLRLPRLRFDGKGFTLNGAPSCCAASASTRRRERTSPPSRTTTCSRNGRGSGTWA